MNKRSKHIIQRQSKPNVNYCHYEYFDRILREYYKFGTTLSK